MNPSELDAIRARIECYNDEKDKFNSLDPLFHLQLTRDQYVSDVSALLAEVERLRATLRLIVALPLGFSNLHEAQVVARVSLEYTEKEETP